MVARFNYLELPSDDLARARGFYERAFGWSMTAFGPTYAATISDDTDLGIDADGDNEARIKAPLPVIEVDDLDACRAAVLAAGGAIDRDIFDFPGGRRFHFTDPDGHVLGAWQRSEG